MVYEKRPFFKMKEDYEVSLKRYEAFFECEIIDRPPISIVLPKENQVPVLSKEYSSHEERMLDIEYRAETGYRNLQNKIYYSDAMPILWPNMGPEIFSAWCGCGYEFGATTAWSSPCIHDWEKDSYKAVFDQEHPLFIKMVEYTNLLLQYGKDNFIVGLTDFHPGGDHLAALRDPQELAIDMIENTFHVKKKLEESYKDYYKVYDIFYEMLSKESMPITSWCPLLYEGRFYIPSNDFSCMISSKMFNEVFLPGLIEECRFYDRSIYHLDGPGALHHLDSLLEIKELDAIQWVCGAGREGYANWIDVYRKIQKAGKALQLIIDIAELDLVFETLRPEGVWFSNISGIGNKEDADAVIKRIEKWK